MKTVVGVGLPGKTAPKKRVFKQGFGECVGVLGGILRGSSDREFSDGLFGSIPCRLDS